jgi:hypothetical protein
VKRGCRHIISSKEGRRSIYVDEENMEEILAYIGQDDRHKKKFRHISDIILSGLRNSSLYDKEDISERCKDVTAMKFFKGQENDRIYCKEIHSSSGSYIVVAAILYQRKKSTKLTRKEINMIEKVGGYQYEV